MQPPPGATAVADPDVHGVGGEVQKHVVDGQAHLDVGMRGGEPPEPRDQHLAAKLVKVLTVSPPPRSRCCSLAVASWMRSNASRMGGRYAWPASVSSSARFWRLNSGRPSHSSSALIWWLIAAWVTCSSAAALVKLRCRAAASKARSALRGGRRRTDRPSDQFS